MYSSRNIWFLARKGLLSMHLPVYHPLPCKARVLFVRPAGVLFAPDGSPEMTRRYVWAAILEDLLAPYPDVCIVYLRAHDEPNEAEMLRTQLGRLGQRVIEILTTGDEAVGSTVAGWRQHHPEVLQVCLLACAALASSNMDCVKCDAALGVSASEVRSQLQVWLQTAQMAA